MNTETSQPEPSDELLILALARGCSFRQAAVESGWSVSTIQRRLDDPDFTKRVADCRNALLARSAGLLASATLTAARKLRTLSGSSNEVIALAASKAVLEMAGRYRTDTEVLDRLAALESKP